jgi:hypothetical protein
MKKSKTDQVIDTMLSHAKSVYDNKKLQDIIIELEGLINSHVLDDPEFIQDKDFALCVCHMLICLNTEHGKVKKGSIAHKLGLRLYDYINSEVV